MSHDIKNNNNSLLVNTKYNNALRDHLVMIFYQEQEEEDLMNQVHLVDYSVHFCVIGVYRLCRGKYI